MVFMENRSLFINGLTIENRESVADQLGLWYHLTLKNILQRKLTGWVFNRDDLGLFLHAKCESTARVDPMGLRVWKLNQIMEFCHIPAPESLDSATLNAVGVEIENQSLILFSRVDGEFQGKSIDDMVEYLLTKIIGNFSENFKTQDPASRKESLEQVVGILRSMPLDQQDKLKEILSIEDFSPDIIRRAIYDHTLSMALITLITMGRYSVYLAVAKIAIAVSGIASFYFARPFVRSLLPLVMMVMSPVGTATIGLGLTWLTDHYTNRQIRSFLLPVMVMTSVLSSVQASPESVGEGMEGFIDSYNP